MGAIRMKEQLEKIIKKTKYGREQKQDEMLRDYKFSIYLYFDYVLRGLAGRPQLISEQYFHPADIETKKIGSSEYKDILFYDVGTIGMTMQKGELHQTTDRMFQSIITKIEKVLQERITYKSIDVEFVFEPPLRRQSSYYEDMKEEFLDVGICFKESGTKEYLSRVLSTCEAKIQEIVAKYTK